MMDNIDENILDTIGPTLMVRINRLISNNGVNIYANLEGFNPTGIIKDLIAMQMIEEAEKSGALKKGQIIIEPTSGNAGIGLAVIGVGKVFDEVNVVGNSVSVERRKIIKSYGAKAVLTPGSEGRTVCGNEQWGGDVCGLNGCQSNRIGQYCRGIPRPGREISLHIYV